MADFITTTSDIQNIVDVSTIFSNFFITAKDQCSKMIKEKDLMKAISYTYAIDSLMYAMLYTKPNICFAVGMVSRYQSNLTMEH